MQKTPSAELRRPSTAETGSTAYVYLVAAVAAISGLLFGFDIAVINGAIIFIREQFGLTEVQTEFAASSLLVGCMLGASAGGVLSDRFGRRRTLIFSALLFAISSVGAALPRTLAEFATARFIGGIAIGVASLLAPLYIAEVAPPRIRGRLVGLNQMAIVTGILLAYSVNWMLSGVGPTGWRWMFLTAAVPSILFFFALLFVPESPRWLVEFGRGEEAVATLARVSGARQAQVQLAEIQNAIAQEGGSIRELLRPGLRTALVIGIVLAILQQITGINTVLFYGSIIFKDHAASGQSSALFANVFVGTVNFLSTIVSLWIIDRVGRKALLMFSAAGMALAEIALGCAFLMSPPPANLILGIILFCAASFAVGLGPGVWIVIAELFPTRIRGRAMSIATVSLWAACVALTATFLSLVRALGASGAFWLYSAMCVTMFLFVWRVVPETKGKTLEQIEQMWRKA
ncbi:MAG TPA: sugar porter family MFS transporter [Bryobacteraceae bacterium]|nr:sugar porter family MFS transporter [Bryobacteraceae bacterium]